MADDPVLRVVDRREGSGRRRVDVTWLAPGRQPRQVSVDDVDLQVDAATAEKVRWYLEDYPEFPADPAPRIAAETERALARLGRDLFTAVFGSGDAAAIWAQATLGGLAPLRIEVDAEPDDAPGLPWELLRDPATDRALVTAAGQFVRTHRQAAPGQAALPDAAGDELRVLLVICRPGGGDDVPFRSVASRLVRGGAQRLPGLQLDVLRPATYARLAQALRAAARAGRPYHVVHFDGHGAYLDLAALTPAREHLGGSGGSGGSVGSGGGTRVEVSPVRYAGGVPRSGRHGYLLFENPDDETNQELVDGPTLARLLADTGVPILVLNACRSAYAEAQPAPARPTADVTDSATQGRQTVHDRIRAYGSLAAEVADHGVPGVVAMRFNVYVVTAAQFVADLYAHLVAGESLGYAATAARKAMADNPTRDIVGVPVALQDWVVPTVYEATPLHLVAPRPQGPSPFRLDVPESTGTVAPEARRTPDAGFFGRDETLLALDRAFDTRTVVMLHALAGAGKTSTAGEFGRWYVQTGGAQAVVWTSFEFHTPLERALDTVGVAFADAFDAGGIHWAAVTDPGQRRELVLQVLSQVPVLWVWDNVEPVAGFPRGTTSAWTPAEQRELAAFLRDVAQTRARVLVTSRRDEQDWLGGLPYRVRLPPMPGREALQLTRALLPQAPVEVDWRPLLRFAAGNPLTITVTARQLAREHTDPAALTTEDVEGFADRVRAGQSPLEGDTDAALGRDRSLAASLDYGFRNAFTDPERAVLAVLHLFRDTVNVAALTLMGDANVVGVDTAVPVLAGLHRKHGIELLERAADVGLLAPHGGGCYGVHPALPWYFTSLARQFVGEPGTPAAVRCEEAYALVYAFLSRYWFRQVEEGRTAAVLDTLRAEETNLLHALHLARAHHQHSHAVSCLQGIRQLYHLTGRSTEWARLVTYVEADYVDPVTDQPLPSCDYDDYSIITRYRLRIAHERRDWPTTARLQTAMTDRNRQRAAPYFETPADQLDDVARHMLRSLAVSEQDLGLLLLEQDDPSCVDHLEAAYDINRQIGDRPGQAIQASNLGNAYLRVPVLRDLDRAQHWHQTDLALALENDNIARARAHSSLATVAYYRFLDAQEAGESEAELLTRLNNSLEGYWKGLDLIPTDHHAYRAAFHNQIGLLFAVAGHVPQAMRHYQQAIRRHEACGDSYGAGVTRYNIAALLEAAGRPRDALQYAGAALDNFQTVGAGATDWIQQTEELIRELGEPPS